MAKDIPGFYYDEEKRKYFRIQKSHRVVAGTGYTQQSIKAAEQIKQDQQRAQTQRKRQQVGNIVRSRLLTRPGSSLSARLGASPRKNGNDALRQYGAGLSRCFVDGRGPPYPNSDGFLGSSFLITRAGVLRASYNFRSTRVDRLPLSDSHIPRTNETIDLPSLFLSNHYLRTPRPADILASIRDTCGGERAVISTDGSPLFTIKPVSATGPVEYLYIEMNVSTWGVETIWDIATSPQSPEIALATDGGLMVGRWREDNVTSIMGIRGLAKKEQMNVAFKGSNIVMSGERSGRVNFTDTRVYQSVVRLLHSSAVLGTRSLRDDNQVLVHGYDTTAIYDLRWTKQVPVHKNARSNHQKQRSQVYIDFAVPRERHSDNYSRGRKIAYSQDLDLVAAANSDASRSTTPSFVTLYSAKTGRVIESPLMRHVYKNPVTCVDIVRVRDGPQSILCLSGGSLDEWAFGKMSWNDVEYYGIKFGDDGRLKVNNKQTEHTFEQQWQMKEMNNRGMSLW